MKRKFWNWVKNEGDLSIERTLFLNGEISDETWYGDEVTPQLSKMSLMQEAEILRYGSIVLAETCLLQLRFTTCFVIITDM